MGADAFSDRNVIVVSFAEDDRAFDALTKLKELESQGQVAIDGATVVSRGEDGQIRVKDEVDDDSMIGTASGGLVGLLIGILGGPLGVLLGGATGLLIGSLFDLDDADDTESVLSDVSKNVQVGRTALLAQLGEQSPEVVDTAMSRVGGSVLRRPVYEIEDEIAAAQDVQREAKKEARKALRKARHEHNRAEVQAKIDELKSKLHHDKKPAATSA